MTIRSKLLWLYGIMLISLLGMGLVYHWTASRWRTAGDRLTGIYLQETRAEQLSAATHRQGAQERVVARRQGCLGDNTRGRQDRLALAGQPRAAVRDNACQDVG